MNILKKRINAIINFFKIIITFIIKLITSLFTKEKKEVIIKEEKKETTNVEKKQIINDSETQLPDTTSILENPSTSTSQVSTIVLKLEKNNIENKESNTSKVKIPWKPEELEDMFNDILEEEYDIQVKYTKYTLAEKIEKLKIKLQPKIEQKIIYYEADRKPKLHDVMKKVIMEELKEKPIKELEPFKRKPKKLKDEIYIIATPLKKEVKLPVKKEIVKKEEKQNKKETPIIEKKGINKPTPIKVEEPKPVITKQKPIINIPKEKKETIKKEVEEKPFIIVPLVDEVPTINLKEEINNTIKATSTILLGATTEVLDNIIKPEPKKEEVKEPSLPPTGSPEPVSIIEPLKQDINNKDIKEQYEDIKIDTPKEVINPEPVLVNLIPDEKIPDIEEIIEEKQEEIVEKKQEEIKQQEKKEDKKEEKKELIKEEVKIIPILNLNPIKEAEQILIKDIEYESLKEDIEDKNYDAIEEKIDRLLNQLEEFLLKNEKNLTTKQKNKIYEEQDKLRNIKNNLHNKKEQDVINETNLLEEYITVQELTSLKKELQQIKMEHKLDLQDNLINKVEDLDHLTREQANKIEQNIIKQKLRKALLVAEIPAIVAFPFIKNKYFRYFTAGLFIHNHFNFLHSVMTHNSTDISLPDLNSITKGRDALNNAIELNYNNIEYLNYLEHTALQKYPGLSQDSDYLIYINRLRNRLNNNYNKLIKKQDSIEYHLSKINRNAKKLRRKRYYQDANGNAA